MKAHISILSDTFRIFRVTSFLVLLVGCAKTSPQFEQAIILSDDSIEASSIFKQTFEQHGGKELIKLKDINVSVDGDWYYLITKIQPEVTDETYRKQSEERILLNPRVYSVKYSGPAGVKHVFREKDSVGVAYNGQQTQDDIKRQASALTADAFWLFVLGPLGLSTRVATWSRLEDGNIDGQQHFRINGKLRPGIGFSDEDFITLWVNKESLLTTRLHITLEGFELTKGAHVDTTYLKFAEVEGFTFPTHFFERVMGPIRLDAHEWWYTGLDINRGLDISDVTLLNWSSKASNMASPILGKAQ